MLPFVRTQSIGEIKPEGVMYAAPRTGEVLEVYVGGFLPGHFAAETVENGDEVFKRVADQMVGQILVDRLGQGELLIGKFKIFGEALKRVVHATVGEPSKNTINDVAERTGVADDFGFELLLAVIADQVRC